MESINHKMKMRGRVDRLDEHDKEGRISENGTKIHTLAKKEDMIRKRIKRRLGKENIESSIGSPLVSYLADMHSTEILKTMETEKKLWLDDLTGLRNRKALRAEVPGILSRILKREGKDCSFLFLDLDYFKKINDVYGHLAGDMALKEFANLIKGEIRESDIAYRWGGEEFTVFLPDANLEGAKEVAERIRNKVARHIFKISNKKGKPVNLKITVSIGCASTGRIGFDKEAESKDILKKLESESDSALFEAKETGRDRIVVFGGTPVSQEGISASMPI